MDHAKELDGEILNRSRIKMRKIRQNYLQRSMIVDRVNGLFKPIRACIFLFSRRCVWRCAFNSTAIDFAIGYIRIHRPELDIFGVTRRN